MYNLKDMISLRNFVLVLFVVFSSFSFANLAFAQVVNPPAGTKIDYPVGSSPIGVAFDNVTNSIWVTNWGSGTVSKVNINDGTRVDYAVGALPRGVAFDNVTNSIWVANSGVNTISKVNIHTGTRVDYMVVAEPFNVAFESVTNSVWVTTAGTAGIISKVDILTGARTDYFDWYYPRGIIFDNVTNSIWIGNYFPVVSRVNIYTGARIDYATGLSKEQLSGVAFDRVTNSVWAVSSFANTVSKVNIFTGAMVDYAVGMDSYSVAFDNVTNSVWVASYTSNFVSKIDIFSGVKVDYTTGVNPSAVAFDNITNSVWVTNAGSNTVSKIAIGGLAQHSPTIVTLGQFKSDGIMPIAEGGVTTEPAAVFRATLSDIDNDTAKLQVELKELTQPFDETNLLESVFVSSGSIATTSKEMIADGQYHWRARAVDNNGNQSEWQEFGIVGNIDFVVKVVPLYTQVRSNYPSQALTTSWFDKTYANGTGNIGAEACGPFIQDCGCAITSAVMVMRYYGIATSTDNQDVNPLNFNSWLSSASNKGYVGNGNFDWPKAAEYSKNPLSGIPRLSYDGRRDIDDNYNTTFGDLTSITDIYVNSGKPVVIWSKNKGHFLVATEKLATTYSVRDPAWYNTKTLQSGITSRALKIRDYSNQFTGVRLYSNASRPVAGISLNLASPAELFIVDPQGRRLGKDPVSNIVYNEIPGGSYGVDGISNADVEDPPSPHEVKNIWIPNPEVGQYITKVIGTGTGSYTLDSLAYDYLGDSHSQTLTAQTQSAFVDEYRLNVPATGEQINLDLALTSQGYDECSTLNGTNLGCPARIDFLSLEKISNSAEVPELISPTGETRYTAPVVSGERGTTEVKAKLYDETKLLALLNTRSVPSDQLCAVFDDTVKDNALVNHLIKTTDNQGKFSFGVSSSANSLTLIESVRETIAGQLKRVCIAETISPQNFNTSGVATREVNQITLTVRNTNSGILVKKTAGHNSQTIDY